MTDPVTQETPTSATASAVDVTVSPGGAAEATANPEAIAEAAAQKAEAAEAEKLYAGKFKTPEDMAKAYKELEKKLGTTPTSNDANPTEAEAGDPADAAGEGEGDTPKGDTQNEEKHEEAGSLDETYGKPVADAIKAAGIDVDAAAKHFSENGELTEADMKAFVDAGFPQPMVEAYLRGATAQSEASEQVAEGQIAKLKSVAGGDEGYAKLQEFIGSQFSAEDKEAFNTAVSSGDFEQAFTAISEANSRMKQEFGTEATPLGGKAAPAQQGFATQAEFFDAMKDPRYKTSPSYREQIEAKLKVSSIF